MDAALAAKLGITPGFSTSAPPGGAPVDTGYSGITASAGLSVGGGRDSLLLLAVLVVGVVALAYWVR